MTRFNDITSFFKTCINVFSIRIAMNHLVRVSTLLPKYKCVLVLGEYLELTANQVSLLCGALLVTITSISTYS